MTNLPDEVTAATAEMAIAMLLACARRIPEPGAILVNTARGSVFDETALVDAWGRGISVPPGSMCSRTSRT